MSSHQESRSPIPSTLFRPGAGTRPPFLAGRAAEQRILAGAAEELDERDERGRANIPHRTSSCTTPEAAARRP